MDTEGGGGDDGGAVLGVSFISSAKAMVVLLPPPKTPPNVPVPEIKIDLRVEELTPSCGLELLPGVPS